MRIVGIWSALVAVVPSMRLMPGVVAVVCLSVRRLRLVRRFVVLCMFPVLVVCVPHDQSSPRPATLPPSRAQTLPLTFFAQVSHHVVLLSAPYVGPSLCAIETQRYPRSHIVQRGHLFLKRLPEDNRVANYDDGRLADLILCTERWMVLGELDIVRHAERFAHAHEMRSMMTCLGSDDYDIHCVQSPESLTQGRVALAKWSVASDLAAWVPPVLCQHRSA